MPNIAPYSTSCLTLDRYARIMGINPVHFQMSYTNDVYPITGQCDDVWYRYAWQFADRVSLDEIALELHTAEQDIQRFINYPLCPTWIRDENIQYPRFYRPETSRYSYLSNGTGVDGSAKSVNARWFKLDQLGQRGTVEIALALPITYIDTTGDGFLDTGSITVTYDPADFPYGDCDLHVYIAGELADPSWEIRYAKQITRDSGAGEITMLFDTWLLVDPDKQATAPQALYSNVKALDLDDPANLLQELDVYVEQVDPALPSVEFKWNTYPETTQYGVSIFKDQDASILIPLPASYNEETLAWDYISSSCTGEPDRMTFWYQAGDKSSKYLAGQTCDPLSDYMAETIAMLATARLKRTFCGCCGASAKAEHWQTDMARQGEDESFLFEFGLTANPFGTKIGEMQAFRRLSAFNIRKLDAALV